MVIISISSGGVWKALQGIFCWCKRFQYLRVFRGIATIEATETGWIQVYQSWLVAPLLIVSVLALLWAYTHNGLVFQLKSGIMLTSGPTQFHCWILRYFYSILLFYYWLYSVQHWRSTATCAAALGLPNLNYIQELT